jgi:hypothetical protein
VKRNANPHRWRQYVCGSDGEQQSNQFHKEAHPWSFSPNRLLSRLALFRHCCDLWI